MEIAVFMAMMIVPFISVAALVVAMLNNKRIASLKSYTRKLAGALPDREGAKAASREFEIDEI